MKSIWENQASLPHFPTLKKDIKTDILIIGGGLTGVLCAYFLNLAGADYTLVEGNTILSGVSKNTTAKITSQHGLIYDKIVKTMGLEKAKLYLQANENAVKKYTDLCKKTDCDFEIKKSYVYSVDNRQKLEDEATALEKLGLDCFNVTPPEFFNTDEIK